jgi:hypothetical protein
MLPPDSDKRIEALDTIRRQSCYLVWGDAIKEETEKKTEVDSDGKHTVEDLNDNVIFLPADVVDYQDNGRAVTAISSSDDADTSSKDLSISNKFIYIGKKTESEGLATSEPSSVDYAVYINGKGAFRMFIAHENSLGKSVIRNLNSYDSGLNWSDGWKFEKTSAPTEDEHVVRINCLSDGEDSEEGTNISVLYNNAQDTVYIFYFYLGAVLCKPIADSVFNMRDLDEQAELINNIPIYAVAGNLESIISESNYEKSDDESPILLNYFQRDSENMKKYYNEEYYSAQPISGYRTKGGYLRVFLVNSNNIVDGYYYDGGFWIPDKSVLI